MKLNWSQESYIKAWNFAASAHINQTYGESATGKGFPYIKHVGSVAMEVIQGLIEDLSLDGDLAVQCALLHDTIEDTQISYTEIESEFGKAVADGVLALTKDKDLDKEQQMLDSLQRIKLQPKEIWMVKLADRITNLSAPMPHWKMDKIIYYQKEAQLILEALKSANALLSDRLSNKIKAYDSFISR
jgi:(p)ppGpp synthase/HD superfamily hydrolase